MDSNQLISRSRARFDHESARRLLKEKYQGKMIFGYRGGMFQAGPELITLLSLYDNQDIVVLDLYETPIDINAGELLELAKQRWQEQMNAWSMEYQTLSRNR